MNIKLRLSCKFQIIINIFVIFMAAVVPNSSFANIPHLDYVETKLNQLAPLSKGSVWQRSQGNRIVGHGPQADSWLLQTPNCWGDASCADTGALRHLANTIEQDIANAQYWVDITTLVTYPDGIFQRGIVAGIKAAYEASPSVQIRILGGTPPVLGNFNTPYTETAQNYMARLKSDLGSDADNIKISVAGVETNWLYSWNHSKIIAVDGKTSIVGGHNLWEAAYGQVANPISDLTMRVEGPASRNAQGFADLLWDFACRRGDGVVNTTFYVDLISTSVVSTCPAKYSAPMSVATGTAEILALGGLGFGMETPGGNQNGLLSANDRAAGCSWLFTDYVNDNREYTVANPEEVGLRALIESAQQSVFLSQQDLIAPCAPPFANSYYDARLFDVLADKLTQNVNVTVVVSSPGATQGLTAPYSNMKKMSEITDVLIRKIKSRAGVSIAQAKAKVCENLKLAPINIASGVLAWENGNKIGNHAKSVAVDDAAFYIGSKNLYPATLQDFGYIVEDPQAAIEYKEYYIMPLWNNSKGAAVVDAHQEICLL
jgi:phosphatidylserine/phosphatidylglycerophosphate/cardiolipin synthase-like enzyme